MVGLSHMFYLDYGKYIIFNAILQVIVYTKEKNAILFTYPPAVSYYTLQSSPYLLLCLAMILTVFLLPWILVSRYDSEIYFACYSKMHAGYQCSTTSFTKRNIFLF